MEACVRTGFGKRNVQEQVGEMYRNCSCSRYIYLVGRSNFTLPTPSIHHISKANTKSVSVMQIFYDTSLVYPFIYYN